MNACHNITTLTHHDIPSLHALHGLCFESPWSMAVFTSTFQTPLGLIGFKIEMCDKIIGFIWARCIGETVDILTLCVHPDHQARGFAKTLLNHMYQHFQNHTFLLEVATTNKIAIHLYKTHQFSIIHTRRKYYKTPNGYLDAYVMEKSS